MSQVLGLPDSSYQIGVRPEIGPEKPTSGGESANLLPIRGDRSVTEELSSESHQLGSKSHAPWKLETRLDHHVDDDCGQNQQVNA